MRILPSDIPNTWTTFSLQWDSCRTEDELQTIAYQALAYFSVEILSSTLKEDQQISLKNFAEARDQKIEAFIQTFNEYAIRENALIHRCPDYAALKRISSQIKQYALILQIEDSQSLIEFNNQWQHSRVSKKLAFYSDQMLTKICDNTLIDLFDDLSFVRRLKDRKREDRVILSIAKIIRVLMHYLKQTCDTVYQRLESKYLAFVFLEVFLDIWEEVTDLIESKQEESSLELFLTQFIQLLEDCDHLYEELDKNRDYQEYKLWKKQKNLSTELSKLLTFSKRFQLIGHSQIKPEAKLLLERKIIAL
jgi:hypothetical protein